jgi:hypothetical protein
MVGEIHVTGNADSDALKEYVGMIWIADQPGERFRVSAHSLAEAKEAVKRTYGEGHVISLYNQGDADRRR